MSLYLVNKLVFIVHDVSSGQSVCCGLSSALLVPTTRRRTLGDRAFAVTCVEQLTSHTDITAVIANV